MVDSDDGGWFSYSPLSATGNRHLTAAQRVFVAERGRAAGSDDGADPDVGPDEPHDPPGGQQSDDS